MSDFFDYSTPVGSAWGRGTSKKAIKRRQIRVYHERMAAEAHAANDAEALYRAQRQLYRGQRVTYKKEMR